MNLSRLQLTSKVTADDWVYPLVPANRSGWLQVDDDPPHALYWEEYGAPDGEPVMVLHGGPGGACDPSLSRFFDPKRYRVILFDQRGCGKSRPTVAADGPDVALKHNTTDYLVADIERLRDELGITGRMHVFGGSWGSTLALVYAIRHPDHVESLILRGIFTGTDGELLYMYQGNAATFEESPLTQTRPGAYISYPDEWRAFLQVIPPEKRGDMMGAYKALFDMKPASEAERALQMRAAVAWSVWEGVISNMIPATTDVGKFGDDNFAVSFAQIEAHFFAHRLFLEENYILKNLGRISGIPIHIVHGRFDQVCPLTLAMRLVEELEKLGATPATFVKTMAGHSAMERETYIALTEIMDGLPPMRP